MREEKTSLRSVGLLMSLPAAKGAESMQRFDNDRFQPSLAVYFVPYVDDNPYQRLLKDALAGERVRVQGANNVAFLLRAPGRRLLPGRGIVHLHWLPAQGYRSLPSALHMLMCMLVLRRAGHKLVWTVHNLRPHDAPHPWLNTMFSFAVARLVHALIAHADSLRLAVERQLLVSRERIHSIPHGNYIGEYPNVVTRQQARERVGIAEGSTCFAFVGYMKPYKGIERLLRAFSLVRDPNARLLLAGPVVSVVYGDSIEAAARTDRRVVMDRRYIPREELQLFMNAASVLVFPFRQVFTSGSIVLAMSFGKPCIAADGPFARELLANQGNFLYDASSRGALAGTLREAIRRDPAELELIGRRNYALAKQWSWEYVAQQTRTVYEGVLV